MGVLEQIEVGVEERSAAGEVAKIKSAKRHFEAMGIDDYAWAVPGAWGI